MKNIKLLYLLNSMYYVWIWLGIWVLYYMKFGGFTAVGILEVVMIVSTIVFEIPTGAIGDLLGKRKTLFIAYLLSGIANIWMGFAPSITHMIVALIVMNFGGALRSGTFEAMAYDSLKDEGKESLYNKVIANLTSIRLATLAVSGIIGGYLYTVSNGLPFIITGVVIILGAVVALFLTEPKVDSEKFTIKNYIKQNIVGFKQLFVSTETTRKTLALLSILFVTLITYEGLNDFLAVGYGFTEVQLGILSAVLSLAGAGASILAAKFEDKINSKLLYLGGIVVFALSLLISPLVGLYLGGLTILLRNILVPIIENESSVITNHYIPSKYRATALSSLAMLKSLPYAISIYFISAAADTYPVTQVAFILGIFTVLAWLYNYGVFGKKVTILPD